MDTVSFRDLSIAETDTKTLLAHATEQGIQRRYEDFLIVDVDGHHYEVSSFAQICAIKPNIRASGSAASPRRPVAAAIRTCSDA